MMKYLTASILTLGLSISVSAADLIPVTTKGEMNHPQFSGNATCVIGQSTGTAAVLCASGSGIILQVIGSSVPTTDYLSFRDSTFSNTSAGLLTAISQINLAGVYLYPRFKNGLSVNASVAPSGPAVLWTVIYAKDLR